MKNTIMLYEKTFSEMYMSNINSKVYSELVFKRNITDYAYTFLLESVYKIN